MLSNSNVGLIGYGKIGKKIQYLIKPFKCKIKIYDPNKTDYSSKRNLNHIIKNSAIIILSIPLNNKNINFIDDKKLKQMKNDAILVNCSRGGLVDEKALYFKLKKNNSFRAIIDCFNLEPYFGKLIKLNNTILSPHVASYTQETRDKMETNSFKNCLNNIDFKSLNEKKNK